MRPALLVVFLLTATLSAQTREEKVRNDRKKVEADGFWIYNDLAKGYAEAKRTGKPLVVILRCVPCEECVKLDDDLINQDKRLVPLLDQFVRVRVVSTNGLDLGLFQFDYDQSFAAFFLNADGTVYGRFGTRSHRTSYADDVSIEGLAKALGGALALHADYPKNKASLAAKVGPKPEFATPEKFPQHRDKYGPTLAAAGKVVPSCIHCHQIGDAQRQQYRDRKEAIPDELLFSYPHPKTLGLILDPKEAATVARVEVGSVAEKAGLKAGDRLLTLGGQPQLSMADVQWVLHRTPAAGATVEGEVRRGERTEVVKMELPKDWRRREDISWRSSTWGLRRMATGGLVLEAATAAERKAAGVGDTGMALRVQYVGQYGPHAAGQNAGFRKGDVLFEFDGRTDLMSETALIAHGVQAKRAGDKVEVTVARVGKRRTLTLPMQP